MDNHNLPPRRLLAFVPPPPIDGDFDDDDDSFDDNSNPILGNLSADANDSDSSWGSDDSLEGDVADLTSPYTLTTTNGNINTTTTSTTSPDDDSDSMFTPPQFRRQLSSGPNSRAHTLQSVGLDKFVGPLVERGVESVADFDKLTPDDLRKIGMDPVQQNIYKMLSERSRQLKVNQDVTSGIGNSDETKVMTARSQSPIKDSDEVGCCESVVMFCFRLPWWC